MSTIEFLDDDFTINGVSSFQVAKTLKQSGLADAAIAEIVGGWFVGVTGTTQPGPFKFTTDVVTPDPNCAITYKRDFSHSDWIDGESRVQAGMTPEELGFNARFHSIENEFDAIAGQFNGLGACNAELRADLIGVVRELEAKITTLQNEIHTQQQDTKHVGPEILGTVAIDGQDAFISKLGDDIKVLKYQSVKIPDIPIPQGPKTGGGTVFVPKNVNPQEMIDVVKGLGETMNGQDIKALFANGQPVTAGDLRTNAPNATLPTGEALGSVIATMPAETKFTDANDAVAKITENIMGQMTKTQTDTIRANTVVGDAVNRTGTALLNSGVTAVVTDADVATALSSAGFSTVGKLSNASTGEITTVLTGAGLDASMAADIVAKANVTKALRNVGGVG